MKLTQIIKEEYSDINSEKQRKIETTPNERVKLLLDIYLLWCSESDNIIPQNVTFRVNPPPYEKMIMDFTELKTRSVLYTKEDITTFSFLIQEINTVEHGRIGYFLSSLIDTHFLRKEQVADESKTTSPYFISTEGLEYFVGLGAYNKADIIVSGNGGEYLGIRMQCGSITVHGTCGRAVGQDMCGGTIYLNGLFESYDWMRNGGEIHYQGKRLRDLWEIEKKK